VKSTSVVQSPESYVPFFIFNLIVQERAINIDTTCFKIKKNSLCPRIARMYGHEPQNNQRISLYNVNTLVSLVQGCPSFSCLRATVVIVGLFAGGACISHNKCFIWLLQLKPNWIRIVYIAFRMQVYIYIYIYIYIYMCVCVCVCVYIQGVTGGMCQTSGGCSLC
jgi:hypothetical protein